MKTAAQKFAAFKDGMAECGLSFWDLADSSQEEYTRLEREAQAEGKGK